jgi:Fe2+ transport system protein B
MQQSKHNFLYPRARYRGAVKPEHLVLNANLQEFAQRVSYICNLQTAGKLSPDQAFEQIVSHLLYYLEDNYLNLMPPTWTGMEFRCPSREKRRKIHQVLGEDIDIMVADSRYGFVRQLVNGATERTREVSSNLSDRIDSVVLNRWFGLPIFLVVLYLMFVLTINVGGAFIDFFDILTLTIFVEGFGELLSAARQKYLSSSS